MKKVFSTLLLISSIVITVVPLVATAQVNIDSPNSCTMSRDVTIGDVVCNDTYSYSIDGEDSVCCLLNTVYNVVDWIFVILVAVAAIFIIIGAMNIVIAGGDSGKVTTGRNYIMYAAIGLFVAFIARAIPGIVIMVIK